MPIKNKQLNNRLKLFFNEYSIPDELSVPYFIDGYYETLLFENKIFYCNFYSKQIASMWNDIYYNNDTILNFLKNNNIDLQLLEEAFIGNHASMLKSISLLNSMCSSDEVLFGKQTTLHKNKIINFLKERKPKIFLSKNEKLVCFQDLKYLSDVETDSCFKNHKFVFISDKNIKKQNTTSIQIDENLFVLWRL